MQDCGQAALTSPWHKWQEQILLPLLLRGLGNRTFCGSQLPASSGKKPLEKSKVSKSGPPACMKSPQNQENSDRRTCLLETVIFSFGKLHGRQQPTCSVTSYNHHCCLSQGKSSCSWLAAVSRTLGIFFRSQEKVQNVPSQPRLSDSLAQLWI